MEPEVIQAEMVLPTYLSFKRIQMYEKYPKGQSRGRHWKHLKQIIQAENYQNYPPDEPNYVNIESLPSMHPCKKICDITGFEAPYYDPRTNLRFASADVFKQVRSLPNDYVQRYLALRNAAVVLKWLSNFDYFGNFLLLLLVFTLFNIHLRLTCILPSAFCHSFETLQFSLCVSFMSLFHTASQTS